MAARAKRADLPDNLEEMLERLGGVPLWRIRMRPAPGTATEKDVVAAEAEPRKRLCELIDGVLVEKAMGATESLLASEIIRLLGNFIDGKDLGVVLGEGGLLRMFPGRVRIPDVSFISWDRIPGGRFSDDPVARLSPNLAVEVLSKSNTKREIELKLRDYFQSGTQLAWVIQPKTQTVEVHTSVDESRSVGKSGTLDGGTVLPGLKIKMTDLFGRLDRIRKRRPQIASLE